MIREKNFLRASVVQNHLARLAGGRGKCYLISMFGFMSLFGKSRDIQRLETQLRERGVHPRLLADAVKLTVLKLLAEAEGRAIPDDRIAEASELVAYCLIGDEDFTQATDPQRRDAAQARIEAAIQAGDSLDARLIMLALHAGAIDPGIVQRHNLDVTD